MSQSRDLPLSLLLPMIVLLPSPWLIPMHYSNKLFLPILLLLCLPLWVIFIGFLTLLVVIIWSLILNSWIMQNMYLLLPSILTANDTKINITHTSHLPTLNRHFPNIYCIPNLALNLISGGLLCEKGLNIFSLLAIQVKIHK